MDDGMEWYDSPSQANDAADAQASAVPQIQGGEGRRAQGESSQRDEDDDTDYWASYDRTPGRTPAQKPSPAPPTMTSAQAANRQRSQSELEYFARYGTEVQPAMDSHDPDEENPELGESTLNGDTLMRSEQPPQPPSRPNGTSMFPTDSAPALGQSIHSDVEAPRPISPTSSHGSSGIERLEEEAAVMSEASDRAQLAIRQHISTDIKSLFRLAKSSGMERRDFERIVKTELECLSLLEQDE